MPVMLLDNLWHQHFGGKDLHRFKPYIIITIINIIIKTGIPLAT